MEPENNNEIKKNNNKKKIILGSIIGVLIGTLMSVSYAFFTYSRTGTNSTLVAGDIYMKYTGTNEINLQNTMPRDTYVEGGYFEFEVTGKNTTTNKDIIYDIVLNHGVENPNSRTVRIQDKFLKFRLVEVTETNNVKIENTPSLIEGKSYNEINNTRIYVRTIPKNTTNEIKHIYRLYMWIDNSVVIGNTNQDYTPTEWANLYASISITVNGDFEEKEVGVSISKKIQQLATSASSYVKNYTTNYINNSSYTYNGTRFDTQDTVGTNSNKKDVYYFTGDGAVTNGNVLFAGFCWQIIRTTDTGGLKLLYNGVAENNKCLTSRSNGKGIIGAEGTQQTTMTAATKYGTGFTYDLSNNTFTLTGVMDKTWSDSTASELIGTYTCLNGNTSCNTTLYYVGHYQSATQASTASYTIGDNAHYSQIGTSAYNGYYDSLALVGYMYNKAYTSQTASAGVGNYANSVTYNGTNYVLGNDTSESKDATHHYRCYDASCEKVMFYYYNNSYVILENGDTNPVYVMLNGKNQGETVDANINKYNSAIKGILDNWYKQNIDSETSVKGLIDTSAVYCNDRSSSNTYGSWNKDALNLTTYLNFKQYNTNRDLRCENITDRFAVGNEKANLEYPVGLLTAPEMGLMGSTYAKSGQYYWGASPRNFYSNYYAFVRNVNTLGSTSYDYTGRSCGARPVVTLSMTAEIEEGNGTVETPYVIGTKIAR